MKKLFQISILLFLLSPILRYYEIPKINVELTSFILLINFFILTFITISRKININNTLKIFLFFLLWSILVSFLSLVLYSFVDFSIEKFNNYIFSLFGIIIFIILLIYKSENTNIYKIYSVISSFLIFAIFVQFIAYYIFRLPLNLKLPFLTLMDNYVTSFQSLTNVLSFGSIPRFSSFFSEPAHFAQYIVPFLIFELNNPTRKNRKNIFIGIVITFSVLISLSGNGIVIIVATWMLFLFKGIFKGKNLKPSNIIVLIFGVLIIVSSIFYFSRYININELFYSSGGGISKADYRVYRGFFIFKELPIFNQIFGVGYRNAQFFIDRYSIYTPFDNPGESVEYMNSIAQILVYFGFIGFSVYFIYFLKIYKKSPDNIRILIIVYFLLSISSSLLFDSVYFMYMLFIMKANDSGLLKKNIPFIEKGVNIYENRIAHNSFWR